MWSQGLPTAPPTPLRRRDALHLTTLVKRFQCDALHCKLCLDPCDCVDFGPTLTKAGIQVFLHAAITKTEDAPPRQTQLHQAR